jgi:hypothetical protein
MRIASRRPPYEKRVVHHSSFCGVGPELSSAIASTASGADITMHSNQASREPPPLRSPLWVRHACPMSGRVRARKHLCEGRTARAVRPAEVTLGLGLLLGHDPERRAAVRAIREEQIEPPARFHALADGRDIRGPRSGVGGCRRSSNKARQPRPGRACDARSSFSG